MDKSYQDGFVEGLRKAALLCDDTAMTLDRASRECENDGEAEISDLAGVGAVYVRHTAARIRNEALGR